MDTYEGQFGEFTITEKDRTDVIIYRIALLITAVSVSFSSIIICTGILGNSTAFIVSILFLIYSIALAIALFKIHIYLKVLHQALQLFLVIGNIASLAIAIIASQQNLTFAAYISQNPLSLFGVGFSIAAVTGIYFKEAFCFNRLETKLLVLLVPILVLGHIFGFLSGGVVEKALAIAWGLLFLVFAIRKLFQAIPDDIGDKSVFAYLERTQKNDGITT